MIKYGFHNISLRKTMILPANMGISWGFHGDFMGISWDKKF